MSIIMLPSMSCGIRNERTSRRRDLAVARGESDGSTALRPECDANELLVIRAIIRIAYAMRLACLLDLFLPDYGLVLLISPTPAPPH